MITMLATLKKITLHINKHSNPPPAFNRTQKASLIILAFSLFNQADTFKPEACLPYCYMERCYALEVSDMLELGVLGSESGWDKNRTQIPFAGNRNHLVGKLLGEKGTRIEGAGRKVRRTGTKFGVGDKC